MVYPRALTKNHTQSVALPQSACGQNWYLSVNVRNPYQGWDKHSRTLNSLGEKSQVANREEGVIKQFDDERKRVDGLRSQHKAALTSSQKSNVDKYLTRAKKYLEDADSIENAWRSGFLGIQPFPISMDYGDIGNGFCIGKYGHESTNIYEPSCPTQDQMIGHNLDAEKWTKLMMGAVLNVRCAEEVIRKAEIKEANKQSKPKIASVTGTLLPPNPGATFEVKPMTPTPVPMPTVPTGMGMAPIPGAPTPMPQPHPIDPIPAAPGPEDYPEDEEPLVSLIEGEEEDLDLDEDMLEEEEGEGVLEEEAETTAPKKKKKKSNVPLIAAAGLGALLLLR